MGIQLRPPLPTLLKRSGSEVLGGIGEGLFWLSEQRVQAGNWADVTGGSGSTLNIHGAIMRVKVLSNQFGR
jgi:hypothetical protein